MVRMLARVLLLLVLVHAKVVVAEEGSVLPEQSRQRELRTGVENGWREPSGIVIGQMITPLGKAFFDGFTASWNEQDPEGRFSIAVSERPSARRGSLVSVDYGPRRLYQAFLPARRGQAREAGGAVAEMVFQRILEDQVGQLFADPDLGRDEF